ncbi:carboxypeptidase-like regulatory domain-containing protein [Lacinutrix sp. Bg11-31]|uniref:carboxypeptidase-like regulatory domain-containing protein n=1 Tax=Lacinutrix sp. Bg11-31 TaxID=2057808 RepID=UPI000C3010BA|nr:carboxypeptidase-like regulatory domain-containing protein [Lacinutrix sp. Bg11-31]AUC82695.1 hypothetical protein CW733_11390 [Lacinutrix sp. Bg11-31]
MKNVVLISLFILSFLTSIAQELKGVVLNEKTNEPIFGASVYFDNTSIGTTTNFDGEFYINLKQHISTPLVVSFVGFKTEIHSVKNFESKKTFKLEVDLNVLSEVVLESRDEWSREFKLKEFRREFLGRSEFGKKCVILNEEVLVLNFERETKQLIVSAKAPVIVKNESLDYVLTYDIEDFYINYDIKIKGRKNLEKLSKTVTFMSYSGTTFFENIDSGKHKLALLNREKAYKGSTLHFMRSIASNSLNEENFQIFKNSTKREPSRHIRILKNDSLNITKVAITSKLDVLCDGNRSSVESKVESFEIDNQGNHSPIDKVIFSGFMGNQRIGDVLPLDYGL